MTVLEVVVQGAWAVLEGAERPVRVFVDNVQEVLYGCPSGNELAEPRLYRPRKGEPVGRFPIRNRVGLGHAGVRGLEVFSEYILAPLQKGSVAQLHSLSA